MKIGIDIDEVVTEYLRSLLVFVEEQTGKKINYLDVFDYRFMKPFGMGVTAIKKLITKHTNETDSLLKLQFVEGAKDAINFLAREHELFFITSRHISNKKKTLSFFENNFPGNNFSINFSGDAWKELKTKTKKELCGEKEIGLLLEDNQDYALDCASKGIKIILFDKPWNKNCKKHANIFRVKDWKESLEKIEEIKDELTKN